MESAENGILATRGEKCWIAGITLGAALVWSSGVGAAQHCVSTSQELSAALAVGQLAQDLTEIRIQAGSYSFSNGPYTYEFPGGLYMSGGWNSGCSNRSLNPTATTISGQSSGNARWFLRSNQSVWIDGLRFLSSAQIYLSNRSHPHHECSASGQQILVRRVMIEGSASGTGSVAALFISSGCHSVRVENSLVFGAALDGIRMECRGGMSYRLVNNTVRDVSGYSLRSVQGTFDGCTSNSIGMNTLHNNLFQSVMLDGATPLAKNNILEQIDTADGGGLFSGSSDNPSVNPQLDGNYRPIEPGSPAINSGTGNIPGGLPGIDIEGSPRVIGSLPDRGAYESNVNDAFILSVTSASDSGTGSLRSVIDQANSSPGLNLIQFNIAGSCPRLITLQSPLPEITDSVVINGFSQNGASWNTLEFGNNSVLCIGIQASELVDVPWGLHVPPTSTAVLKVRGIGFGGFNSGGGLVGPSAVFLQGGSGHEVQGSQFGGAFHGGTLATNTRAVRMMNSASNVLVGGPSPSLRNTVSNSAQAGIEVLGPVSGGHQIVNNYIGTTPGGISAAGNLDGVRLVQSADNEVMDNLISGNSRDGVVIAGENATGNLVAGNRIGDIRGGFVLCGINPLPPCPVLTNRKGVLIENDADNNRIGDAGAAGQQGRPNRIRYNEQHGVRILSGQRNRVISNDIFDNGTVSSELEIDLGAFGIAPIDNDCDAGADSLANRSQNHPSLLSAVGSGTSGEVTGALRSCTNSGDFTAVYRIQVFASPSCDGNGHGPGRYLVGDTNLLMTGSDDSDVTRPFSVTVDHPWLSLPGMSMTATATDIFGNTSEFSQCITMEASDVLFSDRFEMQSGP